MELSVEINAVARSPLMEGTSISRSRDGRMSSATLVFVASASFMPAISQTVVVEDGSSNVQFTGLIVAVSYDAGGFGPANYIASCECVDNGWRLSHPPALLTKVYPAGTTDRAAINDIITQCGLDSWIGTNDADIDIIDSSLPELSFNRNSAREALDAVADATGGVWYLDPESDLHYNTAANGAAAGFDVNTDAPNGTTTFDVEALSYEERFDDPVNSVEVRGGLDTTGSRVTATSTDATSISTYGTFHRVYANDNLTTTGLCQAVADIIIARQKNPEAQGSFRTYRDGLDVDQLIDITCARFGLSADSFLIRELALEQTRREGALVTRYNVTFGERGPSVEEFLRRNRLGTGTGTRNPIGVRCADFTAGGAARLLSPASTYDNLGIFSGALWVYLNALPGSGLTSMLVGKLNNSSGINGWMLDVNESGAVRFYRAKTTTPAQAVSANGVITAGRWHHIYFEGNLASSSTAPAIFANGSEVSYTTQAAGDTGVGYIDDSSFDLEIGYNHTEDTSGGPTRTTNGYIAFLTLRDRKENDDVIMSLSSQPSAQAFRVDSNSLGAWGLGDFNPGSGMTGGDVMRDSSDYGNDLSEGGTIAGAIKTWVEY